MIAERLADVGEFPFELTSEELANACRRAYLRILLGAYVGWSKVELARWLAGPYRRLTQQRDWGSSRTPEQSDALRDTRRGEAAVGNKSSSETRVRAAPSMEVTDAVFGLRSSGAPDSFDLARHPRLYAVVEEGDVPDAPPRAAGVAETRVEELLGQMRADVLVVLRELTTSAGRSAFTSLAMDLDLVAPAVDEAGAEIVVPQARERMSLVDRVLSLVAVDALTRSEDFEHSLFVCSRCEQPVFDVRARPNGVCRVHESGVTRT